MARSAANVYLARQLCSLRLLLAFVVTGLWLFTTLPAAAQAKPIAVSLVPTLGSQTPRVPGWNSFLAGVTNPTARTATLTLYLVPTRFASHPRRVQLALSRATVVVRPRATRFVRLQANGTEDGQFTLFAVEDLENVDIPAYSRDDELVFEQAHWSLQPAGIPYLVELSDGGATHPRGAHSMPRLTSASSRRFAFSRSVPSVANGEFELPTQPAEYAAATAVMAPTNVIDGLSKPAWRALMHWIAAGGTLLVTDAASNELERSRVGSLADGIVAGRPSPLLIAGLSVAANASNPSHWMFETKSDDTVAELPPLAYELLAGFTGPGLRDTAYGGVLSYGLGEVHLLGFNPQAPPFAGLSWTEDKLGGLMESAWLRRRHLVMPLGRQRSNDARTYAIKQQIDAVQYSRGVAYGLAAAGLLYAGVVAGSVVFARRKQQPRWLSLSMALAVLATLLLLVAGRYILGPHKRAHHLSLLELGAGMRQGPRTLYRHLTDVVQDTVVVSPLHQGGMVSLVGPDDFRVLWSLDGSPQLWLHQKQFAPQSQSVMLREDGIFRFGDGVHIVRADGDLTVTNRSGSTLAAVVLRSPNGKVTFFDAIADRQQVRQSEGRSVRVLSAPATAKHFPLLLESLQRHLNEAVPGLSQAWASVEALRSGEVDWWPADVPVLIACVVGGSGNPSDGERTVTLDRSLVRVVGYGGRP